jgi:hypothetical protein
MLRLFAPLVFVACGNPLPKAPHAPVSAEVVERIDLTQFLGTDAEVVGVSALHDELYVVDVQQGIYRLHDERWMGTPTWSSEVTDLLALAPGRFAVTVPSDGLLFDAESQTTWEYFCYEPGFMEEQQSNDDWNGAQYQVTHGVTLDSERELIVAQPQTLDEDDEPVESAVAVYDIDGGGQPLEWHPLDDRAAFAAGAITMDGTRVVLAKDHTLYRFSYGDDDIEGFVNLRRLGIERIEGLVLLENDELWVVDGQRQELLRLRNWRP